MNLQELYNQIMLIAHNLYKDNTDSYVDLKNILSEINNVIIDVVNKQPQDENIILDYVDQFTNAYQDHNCLELADSLYYNISKILVIKSEYDRIKLQQIVSYNDYRTVVAKEENYDINKSIVPEDKEELYKELIDYCEKFDKDNPDVLIDEECNIAVKKENKWWFLNSRYNSKHAAIEWLNGKEPKNFNNVQVICGMANCCYIKEFCDICTEETAVIIYEPDPKIFAINMLYNDMSEILKKDNVILCVEGLNSDVFSQLIHNLIEFTTIKYSNIYISPLYKGLYENEITNILKQYKQIIVSELASGNTVIQKNELYNNNMIKNLQFVLDGTTIGEFKNKVTEKKANLCPAIVVAAGPSLDKNIEELKKAKGKAFIIAVDSSIRMMMLHNIIPDAIVTLDPNKERVLFEDERVRKLPLLYTTFATYDVVKSWEGKKILYTNNYFTQAFMQLMNVPIAIDDAGGSVANAGFIVAQNLGFKNIIMIGLDLAFTDDKKHASVVYEESAIGDKNSESYTYVEGIDGKEILTFHNMKIYKEQFESKIEENPYLNVIDATEGGALIKGSVIMKLSEAIEKYCDNSMDFGEIIESCEELKERIRYKELLDSLNKCIEDCDFVIKKYKECEDIYYKISYEDRTAKITNMLQRIDKNYQQAKHKFVMELIEDYAMLDSAIEEEKMYQKDYKDDSDYERKEIAKTGANIAKSYIESTKKTKKIFEECIEELKQNKQII